HPTLVAQGGPIAQKGQIERLEALLEIGLARGRDLTRGGPGRAPFLVVGNRDAADRAADRSEAARGPGRRLDRPRGGLDLERERTDLDLLAAPDGHRLAARQPATPDHGAIATAHVDDAQRALDVPDDGVPLRHVRVIERQLVERVAAQPNREAIVDHLLGWPPRTGNLNAHGLDRAF